MKKQIILLAHVWLLLIAACSTPPPEGFLISGLFSGGDGHWLYLNRVVGNSLVAVDSTVLGPASDFKFTGKLTHTEFYILSVVSKDRKVTQNLQLLVGPDEQIRLEGNLLGDLKSNYEVKGSRESALIKDLNERLRVTSTRLDSAARVYREALDANVLDSAMRLKIDASSRSIYQAHREYSQRLIEENDSSLVGIMALFQHLGRYETVFSIEEDFALYRQTLERLGPLYPESELVKSLRMIITAQSRKQSAQQTDSRALGVGSVAPEIVLPGPDGKDLALSSLRGQYVLLDFWAAWCSPCRRENPNLVKNYAKYKSRKFTIYQVSLDKDKAAWTEAIRDDKLAWNHVSDLKHWKSEAAQLYNVRSIPTSYLIDPEGKIVAVNLRGDALGEKLRELFRF